LVVVALGWLTWEFGFAPPSAETLLQRLEAATDPEQQQEIATKYLKHYGNRDDDKTKWVKGLSRDLKVKAREHVLLNRFGRENLRARPEADDDAEAYKKTMNALTAENEGDLAAAQAIWSELAERYAKDPGESKAMWGWHAQKKLNDLGTKSQQLNELLKQLNKARLDDVDARFDDELQTRVVAAMRLRELGDFALARDRWDQIAKTLKGDQDRRPEFVLASAEVKKLDPEKGKPKDSAERAALIAQKITRARDLLAMPLPARKTEGRNLLRDIRDLYVGESGDIAKLVEQAKKLLTDNPAP
jgi:hypothetical protein